MRPSDSIAFPVAGGAASLVESAAGSPPLPERMDEAAFQAFYRETAPTLQSYLRRVSGDPALADDILQETFYRFLRVDPPALEPFQMKAYLYRTAGSLLADHWRQLKKERRWSLENFLESEPTENREPGGDALAVFQELKPREQGLLWLAYVEGCDHREIAAAMRLSERSVRVLLFRARRKLAGILKRRGLGPKEET